MNRAQRGSKSDCKVGDDGGDNDGRDELKIKIKFISPFITVSI